MHLRTFVLFSVVSLVFGQNRKITSKLNPDCEACSENTTLVYIKAEGSHDTIHQLWDFTRGTPTIIYAVTGVNLSLQVLWKHDKPVKFNMSEDPSYSFALAISDLVEYNDLKDVGQMYNRSASRFYPLSLSWERFDSVFTEQEAALVMRADRFKRGRRWANGTIDIKLDLLPFRDYAVQLPHLIHTANSTLIDIQLSNLTESRDFNSSRFALRVVLVATEAGNGSMERGMKKSLDDEHTPGVFEILENSTVLVATEAENGSMKRGMKSWDDEHTPGMFEIIEVKTPRCVVSGAGGYMQFRPVAYTQRERSVATSTVVHASDFNRTELRNESTLFQFYRKPLNKELLVQDMVVSFGEPGDGFYRQHNYTAWSSTFGYGAPPVETFSLFVILVIAVGVSVPVLLALSGVAYVLAQRCRQRNAPTRLNEE